MFKRLILNAVKHMDFSIFAQILNTYGRSNR